MEIDLLSPLNFEKVRGVFCFTPSLNHFVLYFL